MSMASIFRFAFQFFILKCVYGFMVLAPRGTCRIKKAELEIWTTKTLCEISGSTGTELFDFALCQVDMCEVPPQGRVSTRWLLQINSNQLPLSETDRTGRIWMKRSECDRLGGLYKYINAEAADYNVHCNISMKLADGRDRQNIHSYVFCGIDECSNKVASVIVLTSRKECRSMGGKRDYDCVLHLAVSPVIDCVPSDSWVKVSSCHNAYSKSIRYCAYTKTIGVSRATRTIGGSLWSLVSLQVGFELSAVFSSKLATSLMTGFNWQNSLANTAIWSQPTSKTFTVKVHPGESVTLSQVVGTCGEFYVQTSEFRLM